MIHFWKRFPKKVPKSNSIVNCDIVNDDFFISLFNKKSSLRKSDYSPVKIMNFKQIYHIVYPAFQIASEPFSGTFFKNLNLPPSFNLKVDSDQGRLDIYAWMTTVILS